VRQILTDHQDEFAALVFVPGDVQKSEQQFGAGPQVGTALGVTGAKLQLVCAVGD